MIQLQNSTKINIIIKTIAEYFVIYANISLKILYYQESQTL